MEKIITTEAAQTVDLATVHEMAAVLNDMGGSMRTVATMVRAMAQRVEALEREVRTLVKVTPAQASAINAAIRQRAGELCELYGAQGCEKEAANAIRKAVKLNAGISAMRDLPRCEYAVAMQVVSMWENRKEMKAIARRKGEKSHE